MPTPETARAEAVAAAAAAFKKDEKHLELLVAVIVSGLIAGRGISKPDEREHLIEDSLQIARRIRAKVGGA